MKTENSLFECTNCGADLGPKGQSHLTNTPGGDQAWSCKPSPALENQTIPSNSCMKCNCDNEPQHTSTDIAMENLALLDMMTREGWSESAVDRVENTLNAHEELLKALKQLANVANQRGMDRTVLASLVDQAWTAIAKAEGKK